jgi:hypothetical protein
MAPSLSSDNTVTWGTVAYGELLVTLRIDKWRVLANGEPERHALVAMGRA